LAHKNVKKIAFHKSVIPHIQDHHKANMILNTIHTENITNSKEIKSFSILQKKEDLPKDIFNMICDSIIEVIINKNNIQFASFRDVLYEMLTYNLDITECIWYILRDLIKNNHLRGPDISDVLKSTFLFLKYYNNNYRPVYHLESIMFTIINKVHHYHEL